MKQKAVMLSVNPKWCALIASGAKTVEVRRNLPKLEAPFKCYIYCTSIPKNNQSDYVFVNAFTGGNIDAWTGHVIGEFVCHKVEKFERGVAFEELSRKSCVEIEELYGYAYTQPHLYGWHISELKMYDTPKQINSFNKWIEGSTEGYAVERPPQGWAYVEEAQ